MASGEPSRCPSGGWTARLPPRGHTQTVSSPNASGKWLEPSVPRFVSLRRGMMRVSTEPGSSPAPHPPAGVGRVLGPLGPAALRASQITVATGIGTWKSSQCKPQPEWRCWCPLAGHRGAGRRQPGRAGACRRGNRQPLGAPARAVLTCGWGKLRTLPRPHADSSGRCGRIHWDPRPNRITRPGSQMSHGPDSPGGAVQRII